MSKWILLPLAGVLACQAATAESFRCGQSIVSEDSTAEEILEKCGAPTSRTSQTEDVYGPGVSGGGRVKRGTTTTETWTYDRGSQSFKMVVVVVDGKVKSVERGG